MPKRSIFVVIIVVGIVIAGVIAYSSYSKKVKEASGGEEIMSSQEVAENVLVYVNQNILRGRATAALIGTVEESGLYKITLNIQDTEYETYATRNGKFWFPESINLTEVELPVAEEGLTIGNFSVSDEEVCKENEKPVVYFFGSESCPHCSWEHPIIKKVAEKFGGYIAFYDNTGTDADMDIFSKFSTGGVPTLVLGCKYYRVGSGEGAGEETESKNLTALFCKLTGNQPGDVCSQVKDLINEIHPG